MNIRSFCANMLMEGLPEQLPNRKKAQAEIESLISILSERRTTISRGGPSFAASWRAPSPTTPSKYADRATARCWSP